MEESTIMKKLRADLQNAAKQDFDKGIIWKFKTFTLFPFLVRMRHLDFVFRAVYPLTYIIFVIVMFAEVRTGSNPDWNLTLYVIFLVGMLISIRTRIDGGSRPVWFWGSTPLTMSIGTSHVHDHCLAGGFRDAPLCAAQHVAMLYGRHLSRAVIVISRDLERIRPCDLIEVVLACHDPTRKCYIGACCARQRESAE